MKLIVMAILFSTIYSDSLYASPKETIIKCSFDGLKPHDYFGFVQFELKCRDWPGQYGAEFEQFKDCDVVYSRASGVQVTSPAVAFGKESKLNNLIYGDIIVLPESLVSPINTNYLLYGGYKLRWTLNRWPEAMTIETCLPNLDAEAKKDGHCATMDLVKRNYIQSCSLK